MLTQDWLTIRDAEIRPSANGQSWLVYQGGKFLYVIAAIPADGKFSNKIMVSFNGHQIQKGQIYETAQEALEGGLEELREYLGW